MTAEAAKIRSITVPFVFKADVKYVMDFCNSKQLEKSPYF